MGAQGASVQMQTTEGDLQAPYWRPATRVAFRFCFVYFSLYCLLNQIVTSLVPLANVDVPDLATLAPVRPVVLWVGAHILRIAAPIAYADTGSGDRTFDWVLVFCELIVALLATAVWSAMDRKRTNYAALYKWFRLCLRIGLAGQMLSYGMAKAIPQQMPFPLLTKLVEPYGNFSPMGVLWSSIGASPAYEIFAGCAELLAGVLLVIPRTVTLGALVCLADMTQVFMLNMTYDVPVKLLSFHLLLMSLFLLAPDFQRLTDFFFLNRTAGPSRQLPIFTTRRANQTALWAQLLIGVWLLSMNLYGGWVSWHSYGGGRPKSELYGIWDVDQQTIDGQLRSPLLTDYGRWRRMIFDLPGMVFLQRMDSSIARYRAVIDAGHGKLLLIDPANKNAKSDMVFQRPKQDQLILDGNMQGHKVRMQLQLVDRQKFLLVSRGFHWVQENPLNR